MPDNLLATSGLALLLVLLGVIVFLCFMGESGDPGDDWTDFDVEREDDYS